MACNRAPVSKPGVILEVLLVLSLRPWTEVHKAGRGGLSLSPTRSCSLFGACAQLWLLCAFLFLVRIFPISFRVSYLSLPPDLTPRMCFREHFLPNWNPSSFLLAFLPLATKCSVVKCVFRAEQFSVRRGVRVGSAFGENVLMMVPRAPSGLDLAHFC